LFPNGQASFIDTAKQGGDAEPIESSTEVTGCCRIRNRIGSEGIEHGRIIAKQFEMLQPGAPCQRVDDQGHDMIGFAIRGMTLQEVDPLVNLIDESRVLSEFDHGADAAVVDGLVSIGEFVLDVNVANDVLFFESASESIKVCVGKSSEILLLASSDARRDTFLHLKSSL
jgi:hypothetical protein